VSGLAKHDQDWKVFQLAEAFPVVWGSYMQGTFVIDWLQFNLNRGLGLDLVLQRMNKIGKYFNWRFSSCLGVLQ